MKRKEAISKKILGGNFQIILFFSNTKNTNNKKPDDLSMYTGDWLRTKIYNLEHMGSASTAIIFEHAPTAIATDIVASNHNTYNEYTSRFTL